MLDLKQFRKLNRIGQSEVASFLGTTVASISQYETGRCKLSKESEQKLINNDKGWLVPDSVFMPNMASTFGDSSQNWPAIVADLSAKIGEQNNQISRLLTIVEQLTSAEKK